MIQTATVQDRANVGRAFGTSMRLDVISAMLSDIETATTGGQRYVMAKTLGLLREVSKDVSHDASDRCGRAIQNALADLARESARMSPDARTFVPRARTLAEVLGSI